MQLILKQNDGGTIQKIGVYNPTDASISNKFISDLLNSQVASETLIDWPVLGKPTMICKESIVRKAPKNSLFFGWPPPRIGYAYTSIQPYSCSSKIGIGISGWPIFEDTAVDYMSIMSLIKAQNYFDYKISWLCNVLNVDYVKLYNSKEYKNNVQDLVCMYYLNYKNNTTSLRNIECAGKRFNIYNNLFPYSPEFMLELANHFQYDEMKRDVEKHGEERWFCKYLKDSKNQPSEEVKILMDLQKEITIETFHLRKEADPSFHLGAWDAGWYQIRMGIINTPIGKSIIPKLRKSNKMLVDLYKEKYLPLLLSCGYFPDILLNLESQRRNNEHTN